MASARLTEVLELARAKGGLSLGEALEAMGPTGIAFTILFLSIPALTPIPGPFGMVFGTALALVSLQIIAGSRTLWLPAIIGKRQVSPAALDLVVRHSMPMIARVEKVVRAGRLKVLTGPTVQALLGVPIFLLAVVIALPIPFGNILPVFSLVVLAVSLMERDGLVTLVGLLLALVTIVTTTVLLQVAIDMISVPKGDGLLSGSDVNWEPRLRYSSPPDPISYLNGFKLCRNAAIAIASCPPTVQIHGDVGWARQITTILPLMGLNRSHDLLQLPVPVACRV